MNRYLYNVNPWWQNKTFNTGIKRSIYLNQLKKDFNTKLMQIVTGLRRVGKTTIVMQLIDELIKNEQISPQKILFFSVEDPSIFNKPIIEVINDFRQEFGIASSERIYVFIDEVQFKNNWEQEIKSIYDSENIKFVLTGSSAMLLSERLSFLTGRYLKYQVFPLNFEEYLTFKNIKIDKSDDYLLQKVLENYFLEGGIPEYVLNKIDKYLETTVESILFKDLVTRFKLRNPKILLDLLYLLSDRVGTPIGSVKLSNVLSINKDTALNYIDYLSKSYITSELKHFSTSRNKEFYNPSKIYFDDNGILSTYASKVNMGALAENTLFNHLKNNLTDAKRLKFGYWYENKKEIDFVISVNNVNTIIESKWVDNIKEVDLSQLNAIVENLKPNKTYFITKNLKKNLKVNDIMVQFIPLRELLLMPISKII